MPSYDTLVLNSPPILDGEAVQKLLNFCTMYNMVEIGTGEVKTMFTVGKLAGSYDYRIRMTVENKEWVKVEGVREPVTRELDYYYIRIECSIHKFLNVHNCFGGPNDIKKSVSLLIDYISKVTNVELPFYRDWEPDRIDVATIFELADSKVCEKVKDRLCDNVYSRRKSKSYDNGVMWPGSTTTCKFYWKGPEFLNHDYKRFTKYIEKNLDYSVSEYHGDLKKQKLLKFRDYIEEVKEQAMKIIRFECELKPRLLKKLFNADRVTVGMLNDDILFNAMYSELGKCVKENEDMGVIRRSDLVRDTLNEKYGASLANCLYSVWAKMVQFGENSVKKEMTKPTFYRYKKQLLEAGVSWSCCNINLQQLSIVPEDFSFINSKYENNDVSKEILEMYSKLEQIA